jgi:hypothetical protein
LNGRFLIYKQSLREVAMNGGSWPIPVIRLNRARTAGIGQKWSLAAASPNVSFPTRKETFEPIAAAQSNLFDG